MQTGRTVDKEDIESGGDGDTTGTSKSYLIAMWIINKGRERKRDIGEVATKWTLVQNRGGHDVRNLFKWEVDHSLAEKEEITEYPGIGVPS